MIAILTGLLLVLIHPGWSLTWLAPVALLPICVASLREVRPGRRILFGYLAGVLYWSAACYWIQDTLEQHGGMGRAESWLLFVLFCLAKAVQMGCFSWLAPLVTRGWWAAPALAALWVTLEWSHNYTGFAWLVLGNAALAWPAMAKLAPDTGVWGISFALALIPAILVTRQWWWSGAFALLLITPSLPVATGAGLTAYVVQPNLSEETSYSPEATLALQKHLAALSRPLATPTVIVWPEVPAPIYEHDRFLSDVARVADAPLLAGVISQNDRGAPLNSALLLSSAGQVLSRYDKVNLVPFGEFVPWPFGAIAQKIATEAGDFAPGTEPVVAHGMGTFICYESVFPNYIRQFPLHGARVLFNLSNDSWFGKSAARDQHFLIVRMRAAENRRWIVRVTNNGITAAIDPAGASHEQQESYRELAASLHYAEEPAVTMYTRAGDWFVYLCLLGLVLLFARKQLFGRAFVSARELPGGGS